MKTRNDLISALEKFASLHRIVEFSVDNYLCEPEEKVPVADRVGRPSVSRMIIPPSESAYERILAEERLNSENYGYRSMIYVPVSMHRCRDLKHFLLLCGFKVNEKYEKYFPGSGVVEVQVKYFSRKKAA